MINIPRWIHPVVVGCVLVSTTSHARDPVLEAAETAEVFVYGKQAKNEALMRAISDPEQYEAMAEQRSKDGGAPNEDIIIDSVEITEIDGDRATAKATYSPKHNKKTRTQADVHLIRVDGKWEVTQPPEHGGEKFDRRRQAGDGPVTDESAILDDLEITEVDGDHATARFKDAHKTDVRLIRIDGKWQLAAPSAPGGE